MTFRLVLAARDSRQEEAVTRLFHSDDEFRLHVAGAPDILAPAELGRFDGVLLFGSAWGIDPVTLLQRVRAEAPTRDFPVILFEDDARLARDAWTAGVDAVFSSTPDAALVLGRCRALMRAWQRRKEEAAEISEGKENVRRFGDLMLELADAASPGVRLRGEEVAWIAGQLAGRFEIPQEFYDDLLTAARLHGIGRCLLRGGAPKTAEPWRWAAASAAELRTIPGLRYAAELVAASNEHWDGSGRPLGLQRGQIPLRSRILRVSVDLVEASLRISADHDTASLVAAAATLAPHAGTLYDPAVVAEVELMLHAAEPNTRDVRRVAVEELEPGMQLAEDLVTASGIKLLAAGGVLTSASLALITRRHQSDPIVHAVKVWILSPVAVPREIGATELAHPSAPDASAVRLADATDSTSSSRNTGTVRGASMPMRTPPRSQDSTTIRIPPPN